MKQKIWDFHGGIHPPENKLISTQSPIEKAPIPSKLILPLQQHAGQPANPVVQVGDSVLKGQLIAEASGYVSAAVHAPTSGTVVDIGQRNIPHPSGLTGLCLVIETDQLDQWGERLPAIDYEKAEPAELLQRIRDAGITGLGGAGFPTSVKLNPSMENTIVTLIINAAECEPYITADDMLMREKAEEVIKGIQIIAQMLMPVECLPVECLIGIEDNKQEAIEILKKTIQQLDAEHQIKVVSIPTKYPSGGEKQLIQILTGKEVPNGGIPADVGIVCQNVGTTSAIYRAVALGEPLISRITTFTGKALATPKNLEVLLGTPIQDLLNDCGLSEEKLSRLIMGGPMMGFTLTDLNAPIIKSTNCILASTADEIPVPPPEQACIRCGMCAEACPATLLPQQLLWYSKTKDFDKALKYNLLDCIECGACSYVCPSNIPLVQYFRFAKGEIRAQELEHSRSERARQRFESRQQRLDNEAAEKEAKRQARAKAAADKQKKMRSAQEGFDAGTAEKHTEADTADDKAAVIQAALARVQAKKEKQKLETQVETPIAESVVNDNNKGD
ncbi:MAG: electron transport complex subunit RsxC [Pseudomonadales bacterium]|nr:electron transport complex subunit RsxC [Pseudomonadales bacterium]